MTGEKRTGRESWGHYEDFPQLPSWEQVMAQPKLPDRLEMIMAALKPARQQLLVGPDWLDPIGLADWAGSAESRAGSTIALGGLPDRGERIDFGPSGQLINRRQWRFDEQKRVTMIIEAAYSNSDTDPLATTNPTSIQAYDWIYDDSYEVAPLVGARYSDYSQPLNGLVEQTASTYWFVPSQLLPIYQIDFLSLRRQAAAELTAHYLAGQPTMLYGRVLNAATATDRRLRVELAGAEIRSVELADTPPQATGAATLDVKRSPGDQFKQSSQKPTGDLSRH